MKKPECDWISESIVIAVKAINSIYSVLLFKKKIAQNENKNFESETHFSKSTHRRSRRRRRHKSYQHIAVC